MAVLITEIVFSLLGKILFTTFSLVPNLVDSKFRQIVCTLLDTMKNAFGVELEAYSVVTPKANTNEEMLFTGSFCYYLASKLSSKSTPSKLGKYLGRIATGLFQCYNLSNNEIYNDLALKYCKSAIRMDRNNPDIWNLYGIISTEFNPHVAQHSFIRACDLDENVIIFNQEC